MNVILLTDISSTSGYGKYAGTYRIATEIRAAGYTCQVIDNYTWMGKEKVKTLLSKFVTDDTLMIGISTTFTGTMPPPDNKNSSDAYWFFGITDADMKEIVKFSKTLNPKLKWVAGGSNINLFTDFSFIDYGVMNKADIAIIKLLEHLSTGSPIKTVQSHNKDAYVTLVNGNDYEVTQEHFNASKIVYEDNDIIFKDEALPIENARGCIFKCSFCTFDLIGKKVGDWTKTEETLYSEMMRNYEMYGTTSYSFADELINESLEKVETLCKVQQRLPFRMEYLSYARSDLITRYPEMREMLLESGAIGLMFGIETFDKKAGLAVGKGMDPRKKKETIERCYELWKGKILLTGTFIVGLPGETEESIWNTVDYLLADTSPFDVVGFAPLYISDTQDSGTLKSEMSMNPKKFGYEIIHEHNDSAVNGPEGADHPSTLYGWKHENMTAHRAYEIIKEIYQKYPTMAAHKINDYTGWLTRYKLLGYSTEEFIDMVRSKNDYSKEINYKIDTIKHAYYEQLLKYDGKTKLSGMTFPWLEK